MEKKHQITAQTQYYKEFLPTFLMVIGLSLFSCQNKEEKKQEIKNIEASADTLATKSIVFDKTTITKKKSDQIPPDSPKTEETKLKKTNSTVSEKSAEEKTSKSDKIKKENPSAAAKLPSDSNAEFPGGIDQFHSFFMKEYKKPESVHYWKLNFTLAFAVEKNGSVSFLECSPPVEEPLEKEIIRILNLCPKWQPGESNGKKVRMQYSVPVLLKTN